MTFRFIELVEIFMAGMAVGALLAMTVWWRAGLLRR